MKTLVKNIRAIDPALGLDEVCDILIDGDRIAEVGQDLSADGAEILDRAGCIAVPGLVDIHVHLRDPGQEYKETIETGTLRQLMVDLLVSALCPIPLLLPIMPPRSITFLTVLGAQAIAECILRAHALWDLKVNRLPRLATWLPMVR